MKRRASDRGPLCWLAMRAGQFWDFIDKRQIDAHAYSVAILWGTVKITGWCMDYATQMHDRPGLEVAAVIGAIIAPWSALQAAAIKFLFDARAGSFKA